MVSMKSDKGMVRSLNEDYADFYEGNRYKVYVVALMGWEDIMLVK